MNLPPEHIHLHFRFSILDSRLGAAAPNTKWSGSSQSKIENPKSKIPAARRAAFTIIEVLVALAIAVAMSVVVAAAYVNILNAYTAIQNNPARDLDLATARNALLAEPDFDTAQKGDQFDGAPPANRHITWSAQIDPTTTADLFQVTFTCQLAGGNDPSQKDQTITEIFRVLRPTWSQGTDAATLRAAAKDRITPLLPPSPLSGITTTGDTGATATPGKAKNGKNPQGGAGGTTGNGKNNNGKNGNKNGGNNTQGGAGNRGAQGGGNLFNNNNGGGNNNGNRPNNNNSGGNRRAPRQ